MTRRAVRVAGFGSLYNFCIMTGQGDDTAACARDTAYDMASARYDTVGLDHDIVLVRTTTRPSARCDTALC